VPEVRVLSGAKSLKRTNLPEWPCFYNIIFLPVTMKLSLTA
jgi:hypothetical protein